MIKKIIITSVFLSITLLSASNYVISLEDKHYKNYVKITPVETTPPAPPEPVEIESPFTGATGGISAAKMQDDVWDCTLSGTSTGSEEVILSLGSPQTFNAINSAGMARLWKYPLSFYASLNGNETYLGDIQTGGYCEEDKKTKITFPTITADSIIIRTPENMYVGEVELILE